MNRFDFHIHATDGRARTGEIITDRGTIRTPVFMPVGTAGTVKAMTPNAVRATGARHGARQHLPPDAPPGRGARRAPRRPAPLMDWQKPILTDSGGFQVMSLSACGRWTRKASLPQPCRRLQAFRLTPNARSRSSACSARHRDVPSTNARPPRDPRAGGGLHAPVDALGGALAATPSSPRARLFGIVQGSTFPDLRAESVNG
jgi:queuine tRNA-ribosyltransferase